MIRLAIFAAGLLVGGGSAVVYFKHNYIKNDLHEKEIEEMRVYYEGNTKPRRRITKSDLTKHQEGPIVEEESVKYEKPPVTPYHEKFKVQEEAADDVADTEHPAEVDPPDAEYEEEYAQGLIINSERSKDKGPKLIKASDFGSESYLDTATLLYYVEDGVLTNEDEEVYEDFDEVEGMLGECLHKFGFDTNDEPSIYVRNMDRGCDYEIVKVFSSFNDA